MGWKYMEGVPSTKKYHVSVAIDLDIHNKFLIKYKEFARKEPSSEHLKGDKRNDIAFIYSLIH